MITVAICTWNRADLLDQTLTEMHKLRIPDGVEWELLVVNNNCTDHTDKVIARHTGQLPLRRLLEMQQGHSNARNCAVRAAKGELLIWTDDDVLVGETWIAEYVKALSENPDTDIFGGPVLPWFEGTPPKWMALVWDRISNAYAIRDLGTESIEFSESIVPFGANFAVRMRSQPSYLYDPAIGRNGKGMLGGDDTTVIRAMLRDGLKGQWLPQASVEHFIPVDRQDTSYLRKYFGGVFQTMYRNQMPERESRRLLGKPRWLLRAAIEGELKYRFHRITAPPEVWIEDLIRSCHLWAKLETS